jgi:hypothetical protein
MYYLITKEGRVVDFCEDKKFFSSYEPKDFDLIESNIALEPSFFNDPSEYVFSEDRTFMFFKESSQEEKEKILSYFHPILPKISLIEIIEAIAELGQKIEEGNSKNTTV